MADEIKLNTTLRVNNGEAKLNWTPGTKSIDQTNPGYYWQTLEVDNSGVTVTPVGLNQNGVTIVRNLDDTSKVVLWVDYASSGGGMAPFSELYPGEHSIFRLPPYGVELEAFAESGTALIEVIILEG